MTDIDTKAAAAARRSRERVLAKAAEKQVEWLAKQIIEHPLVAALDDAILHGDPEALGTWAATMTAHAGRLDAKADLTGQRRWRDHARRLRAGGPDMVTAAIRARRDCIEFLLNHPQSRERTRR